MIYLFSSIVCSALLVVLFKTFERFRINNLHAIVINYFTASSIGLLFLPDACLSGSPCTVLVQGRQGFMPEQVIASPWFLHAVIIGAVFFTLFNIIAYTTQTQGISVASVANKMSLVIPAGAAVYLYGDSFSLLKSAGIIMAMLAVYLASLKKDGEKRLGKNLIFPLIIFFGSGLIDTYFKYTEYHFLAGSEMYLFIPVLFSFAALTGSLALITKVIIYKEKISVLSLLGGIILGIPNYFSVFFLLKTLKIEDLQSSVIFPVNNIGIVMLSALMGLILFREKISAMNWIGIILSAIAVLMISY